MIAGMLPMAVGLGEAGSQTAPLGRAVIGGLDGRDHRHADHLAGHFRDAAKQAIPSKRLIASGRLP